MNAHGELAVTAPLADALAMLVTRTGLGVLRDEICVPD